MLINNICTDGFTIRIHDDYKTGCCPEFRFVCSNNMLGMTDSFTNLGGIRWKLTFCYFVCWCFVAICLSKGIKSLGKASIHRPYISNELAFADNNVLANIHMPCTHEHI